MEVLMLPLPFAEYFLVIVIHFTVGMAGDLRLNGEKSWPDLKTCMEVGQDLADRLAQDFTDVKFYCVPVNKVS
jgi:hypothetical protein